MLREIDYRRMVERDALVIAREFIAEETMLVGNVVRQLPALQTWSLIVVGGAACWHLDSVACDLGRYVIIDPLASGAPIGRTETNRCSPMVLARPLQDVDSSLLPSTQNLWVFTFNVYPYLDRPLWCWRRLAATGDVAVITSWAANAVAQHTRARYLRHVFGADRRRDRAAAASVDALVAVARDVRSARIDAKVEAVPGTVMNAALVSLERRALRAA